MEGKLAVAFLSIFVEFLPFTVNNRSLVFRRSFVYKFPVSELFSFYNISYCNSKELEITAESAEWKTSKCEKLLSVLTIFSP